VHLSDLLNNVAADLWTTQNIDLGMALHDHPDCILVERLFRFAIRLNLVPGNESSQFLGEPTKHIDRLSGWRLGSAESYLFLNLVFEALASFRI
jgi:hypothetical protein